MSAANGNKPVIDRSRITHGEAKRQAWVPIKMDKASRDGDFEALEALIAEGEAFLAKQVVSIPADWLLDGIEFGSPGWLDHISQEHYDELVRLVNPQVGEAKT